MRIADQLGSANQPVGLHHTTVICDDFSPSFGGSPRRAWQWIVLSALLLLIALLTTVRLTQAAELPPVSDEVTPQQTNWTQTLSLPKFNPVSGTLTSVAITLSGVVSGRVGYESLDSSPATVTLSLVADVSIARPDGSAIFLIVPNAHLTETVSAFDGVVDYAGQSGNKRALSARTTELLTLTDPADLALFTGVGTLDLLATANGSSNAAGPGNVRLEREAQAAGVVVTAKYTFVNPAIDLQKTVYLGHDDGAGCPGQEVVIGLLNTPVTYCFAITNTGDAHLDLLALADADLGLNLADLLPLQGTLPLPPNGTALFAYEGTLTGPLLNTATVVGRPVDEEGRRIANAPDVEDSDTARVEPLAPAIQISKTVYSGTGDDTRCPGMERLETLPNRAVTYCFQITNTGNTFLDSIVVTDTTLGLDLTDLTPISGRTPLAPGESLTYRYPTTATVNLFNTAATSGNPTDAQGNDLPNAPNPTDDDTAQVVVIPPARVGDYVWLDENVNGLQERTERGLNGVIVYLLDGNGNYTGRTTTTANHPATGEPGWYEFADLLPGIYQIEFVNPDRLTYAFTTRNASSPQPDATSRDSDANIQNGRTGIFILTAGEQNLTLDAGLIVPTPLAPSAEPRATQTRALFLPMVVHP
jgi:hypothetical protein